MNKKFLTEDDKKRAKLYSKQWMKAHPHAVFRESSNSSRFLQSFYRFRASPTVDSYSLFLAHYFNVSLKRIQKAWNCGHAISLKEAKHGDILFDATTVCLGLLQRQTIPGMVDAVLQNVLPWDSCNKLTDLLLSRFIFGFSLDEKFAVLQWVRNEYQTMEVPLTFPPLSQSAPTHKKVQQMEAFIAALAESTLDLSSPFQAVHLDVRERPGTGGEIFGKLTLVIQLESKSAVRKVSLEIPQQPTHFLGFLLQAERSVTELVDLESRLQVSFSDVEAWNKDTQSLQARKSIKHGIDHVLDNLYSGVLSAIKSQIGLAAATKHEHRFRHLVVKGADYVWVNSRSRPTVTGLDLFFRKRIPTKHKKPKKT